MQLPTLITIIITGISFFASSLALFFKVGKIAKGIEDTDKKVNKMETDLDAYKREHDAEHKTLCDNIYSNQREMSAVGATVQEILKWLERIEKKLDSAISGRND
jgi:uncharacterized protein Yka (UPF0111/DUF47 family)